MPLYEFEPPLIRGYIFLEHDTNFSDEQFLEIFNEDCASLAVSGKSKKEIEEHLIAKYGFRYPNQTTKSEYGHTRNKY